MLVTTSIEKLHTDTTSGIETIGEGGFSIDEISAEVDKFKSNLDDVGGNVEKIREYLSDPQKFLAVILQTVKEEVVIKRLSPLIIEQIYQDVLNRNSIDLSKKGVIGDVKFTGSE